MEQIVHNPATAAVNQKGQSLTLLIMLLIPAAYYFGWAVGPQKWEKRTTLTSGL